MAMGYATLRRRPFGNEVEAIIEATFDNSYPTGGEAYLATDFGFVGNPLVTILEVNAGGKLVEHDRANKKFVIKHFDYDGEADGAAVEVGNTSDQSGVKMTLRVVGKSNKAFTK